MPNVVNLKAIQSEKATYRFTYESDFFEHKDNSLVSGGKLDVLLDVVENKAENVFNVHLSIDGYVVTQCDRCLAELKCPVHTQPDVQVQFGDDGRECVKGIIGWTIMLFFPFRYIRYILMVSVTRQ